MFLYRFADTVELVSVCSAVTYVRKSSFAISTLFLRENPEKINSTLKISMTEVAVSAPVPAQPNVDTVVVRIV